MQLIFPKEQYNAYNATNVNKIKKFHIQYEPMELPCFNFFLGGISTSFLATAPLSEKKDKISYK
jgi:hypothetical protein